MKKLSRHAFLKGMAAAAVMLPLAGCGGQQRESEPAVSASQAASGPCTLSWYVNYSWFTTEWGGNHVSDAVTEQTGVSVQFVAPDGNETEKLAALMNADNLPDLITLGWWESQLSDLINGGYVCSLNELADRYCPEFYEAADADSLNWYTKSDGACYCYPNSSYTPKNYETGRVVSNQSFLVRKDMYEAIGSPDMTTPEGFTAAIHAAAEMFPEVAGQPMIPFGAHEFTEIGNDTFDKILMNFLAVPFEKDGAAYDRYTDPEYLNWLKVFRQLNADGYLSSEIFIDKRSQMEEKVLAGRYFCMLYQRTDIQNQQKQRYEADPESAYMAVDGPRNSAGDAHTLPGGGINGWTVTLISKKCTDPARAIQLMTFLMGEQGQKLISVGVEGEDYTMQDGQAVLTETAQQLYDTDYEAYVRQIGADDTYWMLQNNYMQSSWVDKSDPAIDQMEDWASPYTVYTGQYDYSYEPGTADAAANDTISAQWGELLPQLLLADSVETFDSMIEDFKAFRLENGFEQLQAENSRQMQELKQRLGIG